MSNYPSICVDPPDHLIWNRKRYRCALGWAGLKKDKCEGDGATPIGRFPLRRVFYRADRLAKPKTRLSVRALQPYDGWCDDPSSVNYYNQLVSLPFIPSHERLWRKDEIYDIIVEVGYNDAPALAGKGSAIFIHIAQPTYSPTRGCIALCRQDLITILEGCEYKTDIFIPQRP